MLNHYLVNTLRYDESLCINCGMCVAVCPHGVFAPNGKVVRLARAQACMECGACQENCPTAAIAVESGVGCAQAMMVAALRGEKEATCGGNEGRSSCGGPDTMISQAASSSDRDAGMGSPPAGAAGRTAGAVGGSSCCGSNPAADRQVAAEAARERETERVI